MNEALKHRVIGAVLLVGAVVIILASLFGGDKGNSAGHDETLPASGDHATQPVLSRESNRAGHREAGDHTARVEPLPNELAGGSGGSGNSRPDTATAREKAPQSSGKHSDVAADKPDKASATKDSSRTVEPREGAQSEQKSSSEEATTGRWIIQAASFRDRARAERLKKRLENNGVSAAIIQGSVSDHPVFRVRVGPLRGDHARDHMAERLHRLLDHDVLVLRK